MDLCKPWLIDCQRSWRCATRSSSEVDSLDVGDELDRLTYARRSTRSAGRACWTHLSTGL
jgi:hypothetical protein